jgi:hypothetical protein
MHISFERHREHLLFPTLYFEQASKSVPSVPTNSGVLEYVSEASKHLTTILDIVQGINNVS